MTTLYQLLAYLSRTGIVGPALAVALSREAQRLSVLEQTWALAWLHDALMRGMQGQRRPRTPLTFTAVWWYAMNSVWHFGRVAGGQRLPNIKPQEARNLPHSMRKRRWRSTVGGSEKQGRLLSNADIHQAVLEAQAIARGSGIRIALAGGAALLLFGSRRLTQDVDFVADRVPPLTGTPLSFGGRSITLPSGTPSDWIVRNDDFQRLYEEALEHAVPSEHGTPVIAPEYLAAMKLAAGRPKDEDDLLALLQGGLVDIQRARGIVRRLMGGQFAVQAFDSVVLEADWRRELERKERESRPQE